MYKGLHLQPPLATAAEDYRKIFKDKVGFNTQIVCAHVRLGDTIRNFRDRVGKRIEPEGSWVADAKYMKLTMGWFDEKLSKNNVFLVFSDTLDVVKGWNISQYSSQSVTYAGDYLLHDKLNTSLIEFEILLNHCDHQLLTSGTYGWWAGWKSKGYVLYSELQYVKNNKILPKDENYFPPNFHLVYPCPEDIDRYCGVKEPKDPNWNNWKLDLK